MSKSKTEKRVLPERQEHILEAAIKRFSYFGIQKTTLTELAEDLSISKQTLSYHFQDKHTLVREVIRKISDEYYGQLEQELCKSATVESALLKIIEIKSSFFEKYFMLVMQADYIDHQSPALAPWKRLLRSREYKLIAQLLDRGVSSGELKKTDTQKTASLIIETLSAVAHSIKDKNTLPDSTLFREVFRKQQDITRLFFNGLKS